MSKIKTIATTTLSILGTVKFIELVGDGIVKISRHIKTSNAENNQCNDDTEYMETYVKLNEMVQNELLNLVKAKIENTSEGKELLSQQLKTVKRLKNDIINETNREMEMFKRFKEFSKLNPGVTYEEFIKASM